MDSIVRDYELNHAKEYIGSVLVKRNFPQEILDKLTELYNQLTPLNAAMIEKEAQGICGAFYTEQFREFNMSMLKLTGTGLITGLSLCGIGYLVDKYVCRNILSCRWWHNVSKYLWTFRNWTLKSSTLFKVDEFRLLKI